MILFNLFKNENTKDTNLNERDFINEEDGLGVGILIHYTPVAVSMYLSTDILLENGDTLYNSKKREIIVQGNSVSITLNNKSEIPEIIELYGLNNMNLPLSTIEVTLSW